MTPCPSPSPATVGCRPSARRWAKRTPPTAGMAPTAHLVRRSLPSLHLSRTRRAKSGHDRVAHRVKRRAAFVIPGRKSLHCMAAVSLRRRRPGWGLSRARTIRRRSAVSTGRRAGGPAFFFRGIVKTQSARHAAPSPGAAGKVQPTRGCSSEKNRMAAGLAASEALSRGTAPAGPAGPGNSPPVRGTARPASSPDG